MQEVLHLVALNLFLTRYSTLNLRFSLKNERTKGNRLLTVSYTYRVNNIRLISARNSTAQEKDIYGEL